MPDDAAALEENAAATARLRALVTSLSADDLAASLGGGWTVSTALAHLAFWDGRQRAALAHFAATGEVLSDDTDDAANVGLEPLANAMPGADAARLAVEAAEAVDEAAIALTAEQRAALLAGGDAYQVRRGDHRIEHIEQIERGLGR